METSFPNNQDLNLNNLAFNSTTRNRETFEKRSTVFGTALRDNVQEIKMERPVDLRVDSVHHQ